MTEDVVIVGGGLAGMITALRLSQRGHSVTIFEASQRLGGKAGADENAPDWDEHGWHLFPLWYLNIWALVDELKIRERFIDKTRYAYMRTGEYPQTVYLENPFSWSTALHNVLHGVLSPSDAILYQYTMLDLMSQPVRRRASLDQITVNGFARSRFYCTDAVVDQLEDTVSRASAIESYEMSAMTVRNVMRFWFKYHNPWFRILKGNLHSEFIGPIEKQLRENGCRIELGVQVENLECDSTGVKAIRYTRTNDAHFLEYPVRNLLLAVPPDAVRKLLNPQLMKFAPALREVFYLRSRIMAGLTIYFNKRVEGIPKDHVNFIGTLYETSMIDVTDAWGCEKSIVCFVVSDYTLLQSYPRNEALDLLMDDLRRYLPFLDPQNIRRIDFQPHTGQPLFANTAGAWPYRPTALTELPNLFMAGDYCRSHVDLTCMEGAVTSGLLAAEEIRKKTGKGDTVEIRVPKTYSRAYLVLLKFILLPAILIALIVSILSHLRDPQDQDKP